MSWTEQLTGYMSFDQTDFNQALLEGRRDRAGMSLRLTLYVHDIDEFVTQGPRRAAIIDGRLFSPDLGGVLRVRWGEFELLAPASKLYDALHLRMRYRMNLQDAAGRKLRLRGFKVIENDPGYDSWWDTTTMFTRISKGWWDYPQQAAEAQRYPPEDEHPEHDPELVATAVLRISAVGFLRELTTFRGIDRSACARILDVLRYGWCFGGGLAKAYVGSPITDGRPSFPHDHPTPPWRVRRTSADVDEADWHLVPGRDEEELLSEANGARIFRYALKRQVVPFEVEDLAFPLNLHHIKADADGPTGRRGPVLLAHGAGVRAEMFYGQPLGETLVDYLLRHDYDVWALNWRGSIDFPNNSYTLDQVARYDHPAAVRTVLENTPSPTLRALVHCQGSVSFLMAAVAGFLPKHRESHEDLVTDVVSSAISLFFKVPDKTWLKQRVTLPLVTRLGSGADPQWGIRAINAAAAGLKYVSRYAERPCRNAPCQVANYMYGSGWDVLLRHDNVEDEVHAWTARELGYTPFSLIEQVAESSRNGHIVPADPTDPRTRPSYVATKPRINTTRFTFLGCTRDTMFEAEGQREAAQFLDAFGIDADYLSLAGYGHMDAYWGRDAPEQVFPLIHDGLQWSSSGARPSDTWNPRVDAWERRAEQASPLDIRDRWHLRRHPSPTFSAPPPPRARVLRTP